MSVGALLIIILILALCGVLPIWPHAQTWGYGPSGILGLLILIILILLLVGRL